MIFLINDVFNPYMGLAMYGNDDLILTFFVFLQWPHSLFLHLSIFVSLPPSPSSSVYIPFPLSLVSSVMHPMHYIVHVSFYCCLCFRVCVVSHVVFAIALSLFLSICHVVITS